MSAAADSLRQLAEQATPGPWEANTGGMFPCVNKPGSYSTIAELSVYYGREAETDANVVLIALAPQLALLVADMADALETLERAAAGHPITAPISNSELRALLGRVAALTAKETTDE